MQVCRLLWFWGELYATRATQKGHKTQPVGVCQPTRSAPHALAPDRSGKSAENARSERITDTSCAAVGSEFGHGVPLPGIGSGAIRFGEAVAADSPNRRDVGHQADFPACHDSGATRKRRCNPILTRKFIRSNPQTGKITIPANSSRNQRRSKTPQRTPGHATWKMGVLIAS